MDTFSLSAKSREVTGKKVKQLRNKDLVPAVVYGNKSESRSIEADSRELDKLVANASESSLVELTIDGQPPVEVLIHNVQRHPLSGAIVHVDFLEVDMTTKLETEVALTLVGESAAVKVHGGEINVVHDAIMVRCMPKDLVPEIEVDLSALEENGQSIKVSDLTPPKGIEFVTEADEALVMVHEPRRQAIEKTDEEIAAEGEEIPAVEGEAAPAEEKKE